MQGPMPLSCERKMGSHKSTWKVEQRRMITITPHPIDDNNSNTTWLKNTVQMYAIYWLWLSFFLYIDSLQKTKKNLPFFAKKQKKAKKNFVLIFQLIMPQILYLWTSLNITPPWRTLFSNISTYHHNHSWYRKTMLAKT